MKAKMANPKSKPDRNVLKWWLLKFAFVRNRLQAFFPSPRAEMLNIMRTYNICERNGGAYQIQLCISLPFLVSGSGQRHHPRRMHNFRPKQQDMSHGFKLVWGPNNILSPSYIAFVQVSFVRLMWVHWYFYIDRKIMFTLVIFSNFFTAFRNPVILRTWKTMLDKSFFTEGKRHRRLTR